MPDELSFVGAWVDSWPSIFNTDCIICFTVNSPSHVFHTQQVASRVVSNERIVVSSWNSLSSPPCFLNETARLRLSADSCSIQEIRLSLLYPMFPSLQFSVSYNIFGIHLKASWFVLIFDIFPLRYGLNINTTHIKSKHSKCVFS